MKLVFSSQWKLNFSELDNKFFHAGVQARRRSEDRARVDRLRRGGHGLRQERDEEGAAAEQVQGRRPRRARAHGTVILVG